MPSAMRTHCENCPAGYSCDQTTRTMTLCAVGSYAANGDAAGCRQCPAGSACSRSEDLGTCPNGYYSTLGLGSCVECSIGYTCTGGIRTVCAGGWLHGQTACVACPEDYYCAEGVPPIPCPPGYVSASGVLTCTACTNGQYKTPGACASCPAGYMCPTPVGPPYTCPFGTYSSGGSQFCTACTDGYTCDQGSSLATQFTCPAGFSCTSTNVGTYNNGGTTVTQAAT